MRLGLLLAATGAGAADQSLMLSVLAFATAAFTWRLACAVAWPLSVPVKRFALLSHALMKGFFFNQGLDMSTLLEIHPAIHHVGDKRFERRKRGSRGD